MGQPSVIGPTDARVIVVEPGSTDRLVDRSGAAAEATTPAGGLRFVLAERECLGPDAPAEGSDLVASRVALVPGRDDALRLRAEGWRSPIVVEVELDEETPGRIADLRTSGELVGIVVTSLSDEGAEGTRSSEIDAAVAQGRAIGLLTRALLAGVATVRTDDPATARRVRAVVETLIGTTDSDARMVR